MDQVDSSSDLHHLVPVIVPQGGAAMTGSAQDLKLYAETPAKTADANKFQQRLTCRGPASLQFWSHDLATTTLHVRLFNGCATAKPTFRRNGADFDCSSDRVQR